MGRRRDDPDLWAPHEAAQRYLAHRQADATERSIQTWKYRLKLFHEWCASVGIETVDELERWDLTDYYDHRAASIAPATLSGEMWTLTMFFRYLGDIGAVDGGLHEAVRIPDLDRDDKVSDTTLPPERGLELIRHYRNHPAVRATRDHAMLEIAWFTGARIGGLRGLDVRDFVDHPPFLEFHHRPETGTPLKNKRASERPVGLRDETAAVLREYLARHRRDVHDENGRQPLLASQRSRPVETTVRSWSYLATQPCRYRECPHGKDRASCEWVHRDRASGCPSSRSPHPIRSGSITWQLNRGLPPAVVAARVNSEVSTIEQHYDFASAQERWRRYRDRMEHRRGWLDNLGVDP